MERITGFAPGLCSKSGQISRSCGSTSRALPAGCVITRTGTTSTKAKTRWSQGQINHLIFYFTEQAYSSFCLLQATLFQQNTAVVQDVPHEVLEAPFLHPTTELTQTSREYLWFEIKAAVSSYSDFTVHLLPGRLNVIRYTYPPPKGSKRIGFATCSASASSKSASSASI